MDQVSIAKYIDSTCVKADATKEEIRKLCSAAQEHNFHSVCVTPYRVSTAHDALDSSPIEIICVIGFPDGFTTTDEKINEAKTAIVDGATEIDMVVNIGAIKDGDWDFVKQEISRIAKTIDPVKLKVILEIGFLTKEELIRACQVTKEAGAAFVKTSTGFGPRVPTVEDIRIMRQTVGPDFGVKASGGIKDFKTAKEMIEAGATRLGTSHALEIIGVEENKEEETLSKE